MIKIIKATLFSLFIAAAFASCGGNVSGTQASDAPEALGDAQNRDCLYQVSTLQALTASYYYGATTIGDFLKHGDIAIGTFEGVNGEMIVLDGVCYQALADGTVAVPDTAETIPFAAITWFDNDYTKEITTETDFNTLKAELDKMVAETGANTFYAGKITGEFPEMSVRSIAKQREPYRTLDAAMDADQVVFDYKNVKGTLVAIYCPPYAAGVNAVGWHLHFLSDDKKKGGHVLALKMRKATIALDRTDYFHMTLPTDTYFNTLNLTNQEEAIGREDQGK